MSTIKIDIATPKKLIYSGEADFVVIPGTMGELGIYPKHCPLLTTIQPGEIRVKKGEEDISIYVEGGFCEILPEKITVLGDIAERAESIDIEEAKAALHRAEELKKTAGEKADISTADNFLRQSQIRLKIAERRHHRPGSGR